MRRKPMNRRKVARSFNHRSSRTKAYNLLPGRGGKRF